MSACEICHKNINKRTAPGVKCELCTSTFHIKCVVIGDEVLKALKIGASKWLCLDCRSSTNSSIIDGDNITSEDFDGSTSISNPNLNDLVVILKGMQRKLDSLTNSFNYLCKTLDDQKVTLDQLIKGVKASDHKLEVLEKQLVAQEVKINAMEAQMDRPNQELLQNNVVLCGIPTNSDDIPSIVMKLIHLTGIQITNDDIISIKQMVHNNKNAQMDSLLKHSFIITLKTSEMRNEILSAFRKTKTINYNELATDFSATLQNRRIFLLHHFTKFQARLYSAAKNIKNNFKFQFLWCKDNSIYLRKQTGSKVIQIASFNDINHIVDSYQANTSTVSDIPLIDSEPHTAFRSPRQTASTSLLEV